MRRLTMTMFVSLDGVHQAPGGPDEDRSGGFEHGGWVVPHLDEAGVRLVTDWITSAGAFLLGRRTYEIFASHWPHVTGEDDPIAHALNTRPKYVASTTLENPTWQPTTVIRDVPAAVRGLKYGDGGDVQVHGSGALVQTLMRHDLIDVYRVLVFPVVLGQGRRLFPEGVRPRTLRLTGSSTTSTGVAVLTYEKAGPLTVGSFGLDTET